MIKTGVAKESRQMSETSISGGGSDGWGNVRAIRSRTSHFNRVRVMWDGEGESFHDFHPTISEGDRVAVVSEDDKLRGERNISTGETWYGKTQFGCLMLLALMACIPLVFLGGLGLLGFAGIFGYVWYNNKRIRELVDRELATVR
jgi:hypothetical protein